MSNVRDVVLSILRDDCEVAVADQLNLDAPLFSVDGVSTEPWGLDSLQVLEFVISVDRAFGVKLDDAPKEVWKSVNDIIRFLSSAVE